MKHNIQAFEKIFKRRGDWFDISILKNNAFAYSLHQKAINNFNSTINAFKEEQYFTYLRSFPEIHFDFINNDRLNASAGIDKESGLELVGINAGSIIIIYDLFFRMLSHLIYFHK